MIYKKTYHVRVFLLWLLASVSTVYATDYRVNSTADTNTGTGTSGTLRWCINQVNAAGPGPHTITFDNALSGGVITLSSDLPVVSVSNVTIDGIGDGSGNITIDANGGDNTRYIFRANANGDFATFRNFIVQDTGYEPFRFDGSPTDITIENIVALHTGGNFLNYGVYFQGNALRLSIINFRMTQKQNAFEAAIYISGTANDVLIDNFDLSESGGGSIEAIRFGGVADNVTIRNCDIDLDLIGNADDGDYGIRFLAAASNITLTDNTFTNIDTHSLSFSNTTSNINITNYQFVNGGGGSQTFGMRFVGSASNINMTNVTLDLDHLDTTDDGDYGIFFDAASSNVTLDNITVHDAERYGLYFGGVATDFEIINSTFDNFNGWTGNQMIRFNTVVNGLIMTNVDIDLNVTDNGSSLDDGNHGLYFNSHVNQDDTKTATLTNVRINQADSHAIYTRSIVNNLTIDGSSFTGNSESSPGTNYGIELDNNSQKRNITITNSTFANLGSAAILIDMDGTNATSNNKITNNSISGIVNASHPGYGIWLWNRNGITDLEISGNDIFDNASNGIQIEAVDGVNISENSIYNNPQGINNVSNTGNNGLKQAHGDTPELLSSVNVGGGNYEVTFNLPSFCTDCDVEFFTNNTVDAENNGRTYVQTVLGLSAVGNPHTIVVSSGGNSTGFWTTTLKDNNQNGSVSEFGRSIAIDPQGPANVDDGIALWLRADISGQPIGNFTVNNGWRDFSGHGNHYEQSVSSDPELVDGVTNFNHSVVFDGNDWLNILNSDLKAFPSGNDDRTVFIVSNTTVTSNRSSFSFGRSGAGNQNQSWRHENGNIRYIGWLNDFTGLGVFSVNEPFIGRYDHSGTIASINSNGREVTTSAKTYNTNLSSGSSHIGVRAGAGGEAFQGNISEVIVYNRNLTAPEKNSVESYLAIKYGITLDQTIPTNYVSSDGTILWDATANAAYNNDITGIGRDDATVLHQKQSRSNNTDDIVTIGLGSIETTNVANTNTFVNDKDFLVWGNDDGSVDIQTSERPSGALAEFRLGREWKVQETGTVNNLAVAFGDTPSTAINLELYIDTDGDGDFSNASITTGGVFTNGTVTFTGVDLNDGDLFTLGYTMAVPGGVANNLNLWLKADTNVATVGSNVSEWADVSFNPNITNQPSKTPNANVVLDSGNANFNPSIVFNGANNQRLVGNAPASEWNGALTIFSMAQWLGGATASANGVWTSVHKGIILNADFYNADGAGAFASNSSNTPEGGASNINQFNLITTTYTTNNTSGTSIYQNGSLAENYLGAGLPSSPGTYFEVGGRTDAGQAGRIFNGNIPEVIIYNGIISVLQREKVESYMGLKYGITLQHNYYASDWDGTTGTTFWTLGNGYDNDIAGIGRDDLSTLNQKQSKSVNDDAIVTIGLGGIETTNLDNTNTFSVDKDFLVWGNDGGSTDFQTTELPAGALALQRIGREWKVQETGTVNNLTISFGNITISSLTTNIELYIDTDGDGDFTNATIITGGTIVDGEAFFSGIDLNNGDVFTLGLTSPSPGGVALGLNLWLRADLGTTPSTTGELTAWEDLAQSNNAGQLGGSALPSVIDGSSSLFNFNKAVEFSATSQKIGNITSTTLGTSNYDIITLTKEGMSGNRFFNIGRDNTTFNGTNWDSPAFEVNNNIIIRNLSGTIRYANNPGGNFSTTLPSITYHRFTDVSATKGFNGADTGGVAGYSSVGAPQGGYIVGANSGAGTSGDDIGFRGIVGEFIAYDRNISATERRQVDSYLAIKYGLTLDFTPIINNYFASDAITIWDATTNTTYNNDIAGIGRDDLSALDQKQSKSINDDAIVTIGLGSIEVTNAANSNTFNTDKDFLIWGNDNGNTDFQTTELPSGASAMQRIGREWKVQERGAVNNLTVSFSSIGISPLATNFELYIDTDGDGNFGNAMVITGGTVINGEIVFTGIDLNNGDVFTLGLTNPAPGGVLDNLTTWLRADIDIGTSTNLLQNGNFEAGITGWSATGNYRIANGRLIFNSFNLPPNAVAEQTVTTTAGAQYNLGFEVGGNNNANMRVRIDIVDSATNTVMASQVYSNGQYGYNTIRFSAAGNNTIIRINDVSTATVSLDVWVDNILIFGNFTNIQNGDTINAWRDQSTVGNDAIQIIDASRPVFTDNWSNFNPAVNLVGQQHLVNNSLQPLDVNNYSIFTISEETSINDFAGVFSTNTGTNRGRPATTHIGITGNIGLNNVGFNPSNVSINTPSIPFMLRNITTTGTIEITSNGGDDTNSGSYPGTPSGANEGYYVGRHYGSSVQTLQGNIAETVVYTSPLAGIELLKVESYLALKYGITLNQTVSTNYLASDASVIWDATANATYSNDIAGIGRDDLSALNQKQSRSANSDTVVTIGLGTIEATNEANTNAFTNDKNFLLWGNDNASTTVVNTGIPSAFAEKINRNWRVHETGNIGNTLVQIPNTAITGFTSTTELLLFVADDAGFTTNLITIPLVQNDTNWEATIDFEGTKYFTFGIIAPSDFMRHGKHFRQGEEKSMKF